MDVNRILLDVLIVLLAAKLAAELADRAGLPAVVGEILAGVLIGPSALGFVHDGEALQTLAQLGVILLLLQVGLEMDLGEMRSVGRAAFAVALVGVAVPFASGAIAGAALGMSGKEALFVGAALTATSVGITARVFGDLRALATVEAKTVLGAAIADDVLGLVILTVVTRIVTDGSVSAAGVAWVVAMAVGFVAVATLVGVRIVPPLFAIIRRHSRSSGTLVVLALAFTLAVAELAHAAQLAPIVGAFVAGLALARSTAADRVRRELSPVGHLLIPVFFLQIGIEADVAQLAKPSVFGTAGVLLLVAVGGKLVSAFGLGRAPGDRLLVGIGMIPRGEVGLIFATLGLRAGVFGQDVYAALLIVVLVTTVATPPALRWRLLARRGPRRATAVPVASGSAAVRVGDGGEIELLGEPLPGDALVAALTVARLAHTHPIGGPVLEWLSAFPPGPRRWDDRARRELFALLHEGGARSWRLLTASGVLHRSLPELDDALAPGRADPFDLDPLAAMSLPRLDSVRRASSEYPEPAPVDAALLAALVLDACDGSGAEPLVVARRTVQRLDLGARTEEAVAAVIADAELLSAAIRHPDALDEEPVLRIAVHLGTAERLATLELFTRATLAGELWERERLAALCELVAATLARPELVDRGAAYEVERRREQACTATTDETTRARIRAAPREYVLAQAPEDLLRHAGLCEPPPHRGEVRVRVDRVDRVDRVGSVGSYRVEVVARDRIGLIARTTRALGDAGCSVESAVATTWGDGTALTSYRVSAPEPPRDASLAAELHALLGEGLHAEPADGVALTFDDAGSPWHTRCTAVAADRPGLLRTLATAFAMAQVNVHSARIATEAGTATDVFELSDRSGAKLDAATKERIRAIVAHGGAPVRRRGIRRRRVRADGARLAAEMR